MTQAETAFDDALIPRYRSSAAARMVNIPVATLRVWERRYQVVGPAQSPTGQRLYSSQDVRRLVLIKQLVNRGHGIGMLARMETAALQDMVDEAQQADAVLKGTGPGLPRVETVPVEDPVQVLLVGADAQARWHATLAAMPGVQITGAIDGSPASELSVQRMQADVLLADLGAMHMESVDWLMRLARVAGVRQVIVVYGFANSQVLGALQARGVVLRRAPVQPAVLQQALMDAVRGWRSVARGLRAVPDPAPPPRFDGAALVQLVQHMPRVSCECPRHLADLVTMLGQFEAYSADCESREPADVALHAYLYRVAGHARAIMEEALITLAQAEGIALPERRSGFAPLPPSSHQATA
ncbi:MAG: MerR family transcriptional regulator [Aquabacterium sp.]